MKIEKTGFDIDKTALNETLFHNANGYIGIRASLEENNINNVKKAVRGTYINAFYEFEDISYGERLHGFSKTSQNMVNVIDGQTIKLYLDGEEFNLNNGEILDYKRTLDMDEGVTKRYVHWKSNEGEEIKITVTRLASFSIKELFLMSYEVESVNFNGQLKIVSVLDGDVQNVGSEEDPRVGIEHPHILEVNKIQADIERISISAKTKRSGLEVCATMLNVVDKSTENTIVKEEKKVNQSFLYDIKKGEKITLDKYVVYTDSIRHGNPYEDSFVILRNVIGKDKIYEDQREILNQFWRDADIEIKGNDLLQEGIRFNIYQLFQQVARDSKSNIAAKGLSGEGYGGHYFWDTEIYMIPFFIYTNPDLAKNLIMHRYSILEKARERALEYGYSRGALYPWRTISGNECSGFFPAGSAQHHINTDIGYSVHLYSRVTRDYEFMRDYGFEILVETARTMFDIGHYRRDGKFGIDAVTGPDEYTCIVNNNYYTNAMTKYLFQNVKKNWIKLSETYPEALEKLNKKINFSEKEVDDFAKAAENMYLPYDNQYKINMQDDSFLEKEVWDFENVPKDKYPLLLHYHPLIIYRYQVCKQADVVLADFLREDETNIETIKNDFEYYEKITTHDSSLSTAIFSIMASRIGNVEKAYSYFLNNARLDLDNLHHNTADGLHTACMGGAWMCIVNGFAGMRFSKDKIIFRPILPKEIEEITFKIHFRNRIIEVNLTHEKNNFRRLSGKEITIIVNDEEVTI